MTNEKRDLPPETETCLREAFRENMRRLAARKPDNPYSAPENGRILTFGEVHQNLKDQTSLGLELEQQFIADIFRIAAKKQIPPREMAERYIAVNSPQGPAL